MPKLTANSYTSPRTVMTSRSLTVIKTTGSEWSLCSRNALQSRCIVGICSNPLVCICLLHKYHNKHTLRDEAFSTWLKSQVETTGSTTQCRWRKLDWTANILSAIGHKKSSFHNVTWVQPRSTWSFHVTRGKLYHCAEIFIGKKTHQM